MIGYQCLSNSVAFDPDGLHWGEAARHRALLTALIERIDAGADQIDMHFRPARLGALLDVAAPSPRRPPGVELTVRIGIASGPVIVGDQIGEGTASETAVVGETPNLAARLQALAQPNQIIVSAATRAMLGDHFDIEDLGAYELKGFAEPVQGKSTRTRCL